MIKNSRTVLIDKNPGRNAQTFGIARELGTEVDLIHEPLLALYRNMERSVTSVFTIKVQAIQSSLKARIGTAENQLKSPANFYNLNYRRNLRRYSQWAQKRCGTR